MKSELKVVPDNDNNDTAKVKFIFSAVCFPDKVEETFNLLASYIETTEQISKIDEYELYDAGEGMRSSSMEPKVSKSCTDYAILYATSSLTRPGVSFIDDH